MTTIAEILEQARALRTLMAEHWTEGYYARDAAGKEVYLDDPRACSFCLVGGLEHVTGTPHGLTNGLCDRLSRMAHTLYGDGLYWGNLPNFNDAAGQEKVVTLCDHVVRALEQELVA